MDTSIMDTCLVTLEIILVLGMSVHAAESPAHHVPKMKEYCQWETFNATCAQNEVIVMEMARYGRMQTGRCVTKNYGYVGCVINVLPYMDMLCSGRRTCEFVVPDEKMRSTKPCPKDFASYLDASYSCVPVETGEGASCYSSGRIEVTGRSGFISSVLAEETGRGTERCPWVITAGHGQRINITLHDFTAVKQFSRHASGKHAGTGKHENEVDDTRHRTYCHKYAVIQEAQATRETVVCGGDERQRVVYISATNQVEIHLAKFSSPKKKTSHFLLEYSAIGCPHLTAPPAGWIDRQAEDKVVLGCNTTRETWYLHCDGSRWAGPHRNCTEPPKAEGSVWGVIPEDWSSPIGILIVSALGVALGLVIGISLLSVVLVVFKKKKNSCLTGEPVYEETAQDSDDNVGGHYVIQNKRNSATLLMGDNMEMQTMVDPATYGAIWRSRPPSYSTEPASDAEPGARFTGPATPRAGAMRAEVGGTLPRASELSRVHHDSHVYESPQFIRREGGGVQTLERSKAV